jgi:hypothetical protein
MKHNTPTDPGFAKVLANHKPLSPEKVAWLKQSIREIGKLMVEESKRKSK